MSRGFRVSNSGTDDVERLVFISVIFNIMTPVTVWVYKLCGSKMKLYTSFLGFFKAFWD